MCARAALYLLKHPFRSVAPSWGEVIPSRTSVFFKKRCKVFQISSAEGRWMVLAGAKAKLWQCHWCVCSCDAETRNHHNTKHLVQVFKCTRCIWFIQLIWSVYVCVFCVAKSEIVHGNYGLFFLTGPPKDFSQSFNKTLSSSCAGNS